MLVGILATAILLFPVGAGATQRAVLISIANYETASWRLLAPGNDLTLMRDLTRRWGIPDNRTSVLRDSAATRSAILATLAAAAKSSQRGDSLTIYFSGHAVLVADVYGPERYRGDERHHQPPDTDDEALVAYDSRQGDPMSFVLDDQIAEILGPAKKRGVKIRAIFDCCFAYDGIRAPFAEETPDDVPELGHMKTPRGTEELLAPFEAEPTAEEAVEQPTTTAPPTPDSAPPEPTPTTTEKAVRQALAPGALDLSDAFLLAAAGPRQTAREVYWPLAKRKVPISPMTLGVWAWASETRDWASLISRLRTWHEGRSLTWQPALQGTAAWPSCAAISPQGTATLTDKHGKPVSIRFTAVRKLLQ